MKFFKRIFDSIRRKKKPVTLSLDEYIKRQEYMGNTLDDCQKAILKKNQMVTAEFRTIVK